MACLNFMSGVINIPLHREVTAFQRQHYNESLYLVVGLP